MIAGKHFDLSKKEEILRINSPKAHLGGPYVVVHVDEKDRWAVVALKWNNKPRLAIRWFYDTAGQPFSRQSTWFVIPPQLNTAIINTLPILSHNRKVLNDFLGSEQGDDNKLKTNFLY